MLVDLTKWTPKLSTQQVTGKKKSVISKKNKKIKNSDGRRSDDDKNYSLRAKYYFIILRADYDTG